MFVLYAFLVVLSVSATIDTVNLQTNPFVDYLGVSRWYGFIGPVASIFAIWGLVRKVSWAPRLVAVIGWLTLLLYFVKHMVLLIVFSSGNFDLKPILAAALSVSAILVLRSSNFASNYFSKNA
jgi:fucose 4-O-acetylase-like acetyltransferase